MNKTVASIRKKKSPLKNKNILNFKKLLFKKAQLNAEHTIGKHPNGCQTSVNSINPLYVIRCRAKFA